MHSSILKALGITLISAAAGSAHAAAVTVSGWAYGSGNNVQATGYTGAAGAFGGSLTGAGSFNSSLFMTYCIELEEHFSFSNTAMTGYSLVAGDTYFQTRRGDAGIADRIGRLLSFAGDQPTPANAALTSTALQLAIWNLVYDTDWTVSGTGSFGDLSSNQGAANSLLLGARDTATSRYDVYALEKAGSQDFLLITLHGSNITRLPGVTEVPEPGSLALVAGALAAMAGVGIALRRRPAPTA